MIRAYYGGQLISNPTAVLAWAISVGRIEAADYAEWLAKVTGAGAVAYFDQLFSPDAGRNVALPSGEIATN